MITDGNLILSGSYTNGVWTGQSLAQVVGSYLSTNVIDLASFGGGPQPNQPSDFGAGKLLIGVVSVVTAFTSAGAATLTAQWVQADDAAITVNVGVINQTDAIPYTSLTLGQLIPLELDRAAPYPPRRYLAMRYVVGGATITAGTIVTNVSETYDDILLVGKNAYKPGFAVL